MQSLSKKQARSLALAAQGFGAGRTGQPVTPARFRKAIETMHCVQLDAVPAVVRTQYMPVYSRLGPYPTQLLDQHAYKKDHWFEAYVHEACLLPA